MSLLKLRHSPRWIPPAIILTLILAAPVFAEPEQELEGCAKCHSQAVSREIGPPAELLAKSIHSDLSCDDCHGDIDADNVNLESEHPHGDIQLIGCAECHEDESEVYKKHGRLEVHTDPDIPECWDCHGHHDILPVADQRSRVHPVNLPKTCLKCHTNLNMLAKHEVLRAGPVEMYESSVHGQATTEKGIYLSATCNDCHSSPGPDGAPSAHRILSPRDPESTTYHFNIPDTCGKCHKPISRDFWEGIHGQFVARGEMAAPVCTTCHGEHGIIPPDDPNSPVSPTHVAEQTCAPCHESAVLNEKFGLPGGRLASYIDSYHGLKSKAGDLKVANCSSCHGAHRILPSTDPTSSINASNLRHTCGKCHPGITEDLAQTKIHETGAGLHTGWAEFFRKLYIVLIVATIGLMLLHNIGDWFRKVRDAKKLPHVQRLSMNEVMQHWALMVSFIVLVITGFSLRFSESWWSRLIFGWEGGFEIRGDIHRGAAVVMTATSIWHLFYMFTHRGRHWVRDMVLAMSDFTHVWQNSLYFLGLRAEEPKYKRFSYMEKAEYWALVWGTIIMTGTGIFLWFDYLANRLGLPKGFLDVMLVIHYYEAWLATLAILVWHVYHTVFKPTVYPMNTAWLAGRMSKVMYDHEHPDGPRLKGRKFRPRLEEEVEDNALGSHDEEEHEH
ncbi:MAG: cytochrome b/b6 domain-containing protein [Phycisphaerales bacterium]|nr:cytochrome b/b6 domain-containing protein [Phycisphaerales bacterium]